MALKPDGGDDDEKTDWHSRSRTRYQTGVSGNDIWEFGKVNG